MDGYLELHFKFWSLVFNKVSHITQSLNWMSSIIILYLKQKALVHISANIVSFMSSDGFISR